MFSFLTALILSVPLAHASGNTPDVCLKVLPLLNSPIEFLGLSQPIEKKLKAKKFSTILALITNTMDEVRARALLSVGEIAEVDARLYDRKVSFGKPLRYVALTLLKEENPETLLALPLSELYWPDRCQKAFEDANIQTIGDLCAKSPEDLIALKNYSYVELLETIETLEHLNLSLSGPLSPALKGELKKAKASLSTESLPLSHLGITPGERTLLAHKNVSDTVDSLLAVDPAVLIETLGIARFNELLNLANSKKLRTSYWNRRVHSQRPILEFLARCQAMDVSEKKAILISSMPLRPYPKQILLDKGIFTISRLLDFSEADLKSMKVPEPTVRDVKKVLNLIGLSFPASGVVRPTADPEAIVNLD